MAQKVPFTPKPPIDLALQETKLNQLLREVSACVNKKVTDPHALEKFKNAFRTVQPNNLKGGNLKEYQKEALVWMIQLAYKKINGILADDMGLGKTIQTISYFAYLKQQHGITGKHLIICPLTVCNNWQREIKKWMPDLHVEILWGTEQARQHGLANIVKPRKFDVLITPFHSAVAVKNVLKKIPWETFVIDQAHKIKNDQAILTQSVKQFNAQFKLLLTGTPLSNNLRQLWSLLNFIMPEIFYDRSLFDQIQDGINSHVGDQNQKFEIQCRIAKKFHGIIRPFIMRRTKKEIDLGLPPKTQHTLYVSMSRLQLKLYKNYLKYKSVYGPNKNKATNSQMTTRKICNHPYLFEEIEDENSDQFGEHLVENCGKMIVLDKLLEKLIKKEKRKILIFSQFKIQLNILEDFCNMRDYAYFRLDGDTDIEDREEMMRVFNEDTNYSVPIFMLSTRAGGLGVNLVSASVVIIYDIDWNPQNDAQAMDRAYRIGQTKPVNVYKMVTEHTIEQRMLQVQKYKLIWDELVIQKGTIMNIKNDDIFSGLNYEKIANMKKGEIFKIEATRDNKTIDEIIKMGHVKDDKKYNQIKDKILKQIEEQKTKQNFSANPFDQNEINDEEGEKLLRKFNGEEIGKKKEEVSVRNQKRTKHTFMANLQLPEYHLYQNLQKYKEMLWENERLTRELGNMDEDDPEGTVRKQQLEKQIEILKSKTEEIQERAFTIWDKQEFDTFVGQQKKELTSNSDNLKTLHELIPSKNLNQIRKYKDAFYTIQSRDLPRMIRIRNEIKNAQLANKNAQERTQFHQYLKKNNAIYSKSKAPIQNLLNNLRIESQIQGEKEFLQSDVYLKNECVEFLKELQGDIEFESYQNKVINSKQLLKRFFGNSATTFTQAIEHPDAQKLIKTDHQNRLAKVLADINRKCFSKTGEPNTAKKQPSKQEKISKE